jgi:Fe-S-cluster containining protein
VWALSIHADYACRHSGKCCSTAWDVPIELPVYRSLDEAVARGRIRVAAHARGLAPFVVDDALPEEEAAIFERTDTGECVFFDRGPNLCVIHRELGQAALPSTCRQFPRLAVRDARGTFITLSHFCPTAASLLFRADVPLEIVADPPAFPPADYEGLVVTAEDLPPLLHPRTLMDLQGFSSWERHMVARCAALDSTPESVLATLRRDAWLLRTWQPDRGTLANAVAALPHTDEHADIWRFDEDLRRFDGVMRAVPEDLLPPPDTDGLDAAFEMLVRPGWSAFRRPLNHYLAAKAFASWTAYQGPGLATTVRGLQAALSTVRVEAARQCRDAGRALDAELLLEAFRAADFALNHLAVGEDLATGWATAEQDGL